MAFLSEDLTGHGLKLQVVRGINLFLPNIRATLLYPQNSFVTLVAWRICNPGMGEAGIGRFLELLKQPTSLS